MQNQGWPQQRFKGNYQGYKGGHGPSNRGSSQQQQPNRMSKMEETLTQYM